MRWKTLKFFESDSKNEKQTYSFWSLVKNGKKHLISLNWSEEKSNVI